MPSPDAPSARTWTVSKLQSLQFEGDAAALGAYVDAIIDNNYEDDNADPQLLRQHALNELTEFLGEEHAIDFVNGLMSYLATLTQQQSKPSQIDPSSQPEQQQQQSEPQNLSDNSLSIQPKRRDVNNDDRLSKPLGIFPSKDFSPDEKEHERERESERDRDRERERTRRPRSPPRPRNHIQSRAPIDDNRNPSRDRDRNRDVRGRIRLQKPSIHSRLGDRTAGGNDRDRRPYSSSAVHERLGDRDRETRGSGKRQRDETNADEFPRRERDRDTRRGGDNVKRGRIDETGGKSKGKDDSRMPVPPWALMPPPYGMIPGMMPPPPPASIKKLPVLLMSDIPADKMQMGTIVGFCEQFGPVADLKWIHPHSAVILFRERQDALRALDSTEPIFNNRHVKLVWAKDADLSAAGAQSFFATAANAKVAKEKEKEVNEKPKPRGRDRDGINKKLAGGEERRGKKLPNVNQAEQRAKDEAAAEEDLRKKKAEIAARRKEQDRRKAEVQSRLTELLSEQKELLHRVAAGVSDEEKRQIMGEMRQKQQEAGALQQELRPSPPTPTRQKQQTVKPFPSREALTKDNRPRVVCVRSATDDVDEVKAFSVFRDTEAVVKVNREWLIKLASRRAAESATRAIGPLKRGFGQAATAAIVAVIFPEDQATTIDGVQKVIKLRKAQFKQQGNQVGPIPSNLQRQGNSNFHGGNPFGRGGHTGFGLNRQTQSQQDVGFGNDGNGKAFAFDSTPLNRYGNGGSGEHGMNGNESVFAISNVTPQQPQQQLQVQDPNSMTEAEKAGAMVD